VNVLRLLAEDDLHSDPVPLKEVLQVFKPGAVNLSLR